MLDLDSTQLLQIAGALLACVIIFIAAYMSPPRVSIAILLVMIPFQPVATSYGSANVVMAYVLIGALILSGRLRYVPMLGFILAVVFAWLVSMGQLPKSVWVLHGIEVMALVSGFIVFILAYNLAREAVNPRYIINILILSNVLCVLYCLVQLSIGTGESLELFGAKELALNKNRAGGDARLVGPFDSPGITAAYFMSMTLLLVYEAVHSRSWRRIGVAGLAVANIAMILATANRGSFLVLLVSMLGFLYLFRSKLGFAGIVQVLVASSIVIVGSATIVASYTEFGSMFERLARTTETDDGLPSTRAKVWPIAWENIQAKPMFGHGPRIMQRHELRWRNVPEQQLIAPYPHNLYLHLLVTVGIVGTMAMLAFFVRLLWRVYTGAARGKFETEYEQGFVMIGVLVIAAFLADELKIEFLRNATVDYAHFIFALFGVFLGWADHGRRQASLQAAVPVENVDAEAVEPELQGAVPTSIYQVRVRTTGT